MNTPVAVKRQTEMTKSTEVPTFFNVFRNEFDQMLDRLSTRMTPWMLPYFGEEGFISKAWTGAPLPSVDVAEDDKSYIITAELPGLTAEDVDVSLKNGSLRIKGEKQSETKKEGKNYYLAERIYGSFDRSFRLPEGVDRDNIKADVSKGVLTVSLPKTEAAKTKAQKINVKAT